ncbi:LuxR C-terminal-related transcriptional regulator [Umezawaea sp. Da 62-37]|uniref:helix-turn-helix transcriptional regulator n=1 Tax=Umezawaea sp. Da 62-37 TaxID=3075927 RepID=UPI0028F7356C|nr:LuxR C-terminal-related transcriptional regulator [Umezawaea sp. Da 62-37]WNV88152.1 LuxR C-terminal-related transcriptional regulator [Umezawaea sp. Da 62-37]
MDRSRDRRRTADRHEAGRREEDQRNAEIVHALDDALASVSDLVGSLGADPALPAPTAERLRALDQELARIVGVGRGVSDEAAEVRQLASHLTRREWECLGLLVQGFTTGAMAERMSVSTTTVRTHVQSLLAKLGVHSRLEAVALTARTSLLSGVPWG